MATEPFNQQAALSPIQSGVQKQQAAAAAKAVIVNKIRDQLIQQSSQYGFGWKGNEPAAYHAGMVADMLANQGVTDLKQVGYSSDKNYLVNKETGQQINWYKSKSHPNEGPLANKGQIGWSAKGQGRTNYMVKPDAQGNPVFYPQWHNEAPTGVGGFLLDVAPAVVGAFNPLAGAALSATEGVFRGDDPFEILKGAGTSYLSGLAGGKIGALAGDAGTYANAIARGATTGGVGAGLSGQDILAGALKGGAVGGLTNAGMQGYRALTDTPGLTTSGAGGGLKAIPNQTEYTPGQADYSLTSPSTGSQGQGMTMGGAPSGQGLNFDAGAFQTGLQFDQPSSSQPRYGTNQSLGGATGEKFASTLLGMGGNALFSPSTGNRSQTVAPQATGGYTPQQVSTVSTQGVSEYAPAGDVESKTTGGVRRNVWNEASLRNALGI
jgi:hypothetical protein